jgi:DNA mismatch repair protein MSH6
MRKAGTSKANPKAKGKKPAAEEDEGDDGSGDKIVRRELKQVFTNGTIVDGVYLTSDEANYCVSIKVSCPKKCTSVMS